MALRPVGTAPGDATPMAWAALGEDAFQCLQHPVEIAGQRASALRFAAARVQALLHTLVLFVFLPRGFSNHDLRAHLAPLLTPGRMTYDLRRLRLHGFIERLSGTHRYRLTARELQTALFYTRVYALILRPGLALINATAVAPRASLQAYLQRRTTSSRHLVHEVKLAA